jgi:hypothetical protein
VLFGRAVTLSGRLRSGAAGQPVAVFALPFGARSMGRLAVVSTGAGGEWLLRARPSILTTYQARAGPRLTARVEVGVEPELSVSVRADGTVAAHVSIGRSFAGRPLELQRAQGRGWATVEQVALDVRSDAVFAAPVRSGVTVMRVAMSVNAAGPGLLGAASHAFVYHARASARAEVSIASAGLRVLFGHSIALFGRVLPAVSGRELVLLIRPYDASAATGRTVVTGPGGRWSFRASPVIQTSYSVRFGSALSRRVVVGVEPRVTVAVLGSGGISAHVSTARPLAGRLLQLQEQTPAGGWSTILRSRLDGHGRALFAAPAVSGSETMRVALSINQAGSGLLGASSHPFAYPSGACDALPGILPLSVPGC